MMKKRLSTLMLLALAVVLSACGQSITPSPTQTTDSNAEDKTSGQGQSPASNGADNNASKDSQRNSNANPTNDSNTISPDATNEMKDIDKTDPNSDNAVAKGLGREGVPLSLPKEFPLPEEFTIKTAYADVDGEGKNSVLLIYSTKSSLEEIAQMYKDYFKANKFSVNSQIVDKTTLVFQADDKELGQSWSLIGGLLAPEFEIMQVTLNWEEL